MNQLPISQRTKSQVKTFRADWIDPKDNKPRALIARVRWDDECGNGHNSFAITGDLYEPGHRKGEIKLTVKKVNLYLSSCGCLHDLIAERIPELAPFIKWHLVGSDGPLHYIENAKYWAGGYPQACTGGPGGPPNMEDLKSTIVYGAIDSDTKQTDRENFLGAENWPRFEKFLVNRLPDLMNRFKADIEKLGFVY